MTLKCPACKSQDIRRSHWRRGDPPMRMVLFTAYRCRECHQRFFRLASAPIIGTAVVLLFFGAIALGWAFGSVFLATEPEAEPTATSSTAAAAVLESSVTPAPAATDPWAALAEQGDAKAQFQLGMAYRSGDAARRDYALSYQWLEKAAKQGYAEAEYVLGYMHLAGDGVLQSFPAAFQWFERAAQKNHADAQYNLGRMYRRGYGVPVSNGKAYMWFNLAAAQGHERARDARDTVLPLMNAEEVRSAQRAAEEWRPEAASR